MARKIPIDHPFVQSDYDAHFFLAEPEEEATSPSLPIILFSAAFGLGISIITLYLTYGVLSLSIVVSAGLTTTALLFGIGFVAVTASILTSSKATVTNVAFSCGLILMTILFFGLCTLSSAIAATLFLIWSR
ncbi:hypothetical protein KFU94_53715 [Chloroflexi bacterium TSY]|nr:hypothetical protein [Chloroflexi bacterium TSY]